jgi:phenylpropionate dioxygenase-like ring-hydroxylating dioxygenase large terminal subunit
MREALPVLLEDRAAVTAALLRHVGDRTTDQLPSARSIQARDYCDAELAARERRLIFGQVPIVAAHSSDLPACHDFRIVRLPNNEAVLVRLPDATVKAFVNSCRHRGSRLVTEESGTRRMFTCGYHGWAYRPDGSLAAVTRERTFGEVDRACHALVELPVQERHGLVWVIDRVGAAIDVAGWLGTELDDALSAYGLEEYTSYRSMTIEEDLNWKILMDGFVDNYHIDVVHPTSVAPFFHSDTMVYDRIGRHGRTIAPRTSIAEITDEPAPEALLEHHVTVGYSIMPNVMLLRQPDHFELLHFLPHPQEPCRATMHMRLLVPRPPETDRQERYWAKNWELLVAALRDEDLVLLRGQQSALLNQGTGPVTFGRNEIVNQAFHEWLDTALSSAEPIT